VLLQTDRLHLHTLGVAYADQLATYYQENHLHFAEGMPLITEEYFSKKFHKQSLSYQKKQMEKMEMFRFYLFLNEDKKMENIVGDVGLSNIIYGGFLSSTIGYKLDHCHINKGYMLEALKRIIAFAFTQLNLHRIEANIMPRNNRSLSLIKKLGFKKEGYSPNFLKINGKWEDHIRFALLHG